METKIIEPASASVELPDAVKTVARKAGIHIKNVTMKNFLSVGAVTSALPLDKHGLTLVLGANTDTNGAMTRNGAGKAQPVDCRIKTPFGWSRMGDMKVGDLVETPSGRYGRVDGIFPQGKIPVYKITFSDGRSTEACGDHIWKTWSKNGSWKWQNKTTSELISHIDGTPSRRSYVPLIENISAPDINLPIDPRVMGILLGDGHLTGLSISSNDSEIIEYVRENLPDDYNIVHSSDYDYRISRGRGKKGHDCRLRQVLCFYGLNKTKAETKFIPQDFKNGSLQQRLDLLSGLIDTDGTVGKHGEISFTTVSKRLCDDFCEVVRSIGGIAKVTERVPSYTYKGEKKQGRPAFTIRVRYKNPRALVRLTRKRKNLSLNYQYANSLRLEILSIEPVGYKEAQCISIDDQDHLYITDDYVVTHNTTILQAISFALYGKPLSKIKLPNLVNNVNNKQMVVTIEFDRGGVSYKVERGKKPDVMKFFVNNQEIKDDDDSDTGSEQGENRHTQEEIEKVIGMSHNMFKHIVALNSHTDPFLRMRVSDQREVIEELLGVTQLSSRADVLKKIITQTKDDIKSEQANINATKEANSRIELAIRQADSLSDAWIRSHNKTVGQLSDDIDQLSNIDYEREIIKFDDIDSWTIKEKDISAKKSSLSKEIKLIEQSANSLKANSAQFLKESQNDNQSQIDRLEQEISRKERDIERKNTSIEKDHKELAIIQNDLENPNEHSCTSCGQTLSGTEHINAVIKNLEENLSALQKRVTREEKELANLITEIDHINSEIDKVISETKTKQSEYKKKYDDNLKEIAKFDASISEKKLHENDLNEQYLKLGKCPTSIFATRDEVYKAKQSFDALVRELEIELEKKNPYDEQILSYRSTIVEVDYDALNNLDNLLKHQEVLLKLLTSKDSFIRKKIIDQNLAYLNSRMNYYLDKLGLPHEVKFMSDLSVEIILLGRDFDFEQLSRGEMNRVIMATSWSFRDVWESLNESFNLMFIDELMDNGLDGQGVESALAVLKGMARDRAKNVFLISHREELVGRIDQVLLVRKENGFTRFEEDLSVP